MHREEYNESRPHVPEGAVGLERRPSLVHQVGLMTCANVRQSGSK